MTPAGLAVALVLGLALPAIRARAQCPDGTPPPCGPRAPQPISVAVLPFTNLSRDSGDAYLAEGLTEELTSRIGAIERLRVPGRIVVLRAQGEDPDLAALARRLGVRYLVEGSVRRGSSRLRVSVRLLRAADGVRVWGDDFDRSELDLLDIQVAIAEEVARGVAGRLLPAEQAVLTRRPTRHPVAWDHFLRGNHLIDTRSARSLALALDQYGQALARDSNFGAAQARIAYVYALGDGYGLEGVPAESIIPRGERAAQRALLLDPNASDAWLAWGWLQAGRNTVAAMREARLAFERSVQLDRRNAEAHHQMGQILVFLEVDSASVASYERALALEPGRAQTLYELALVHSFARRWDIALRLTDSAVAENPLHARAYFGRARARIALGDAVGARRDAARAGELASGEVRLEALVAQVSAAAAAGDSAAARDHLATLQRALLLEGEWLFPQDYLAMAHVSLGQREAALAILGRIPPSVIHSWLLRFPEFDPIRTEPRFQRVVAAARAAP